MAGPYLKSGETIVLTTDRVLIGEKEYDLILTSHRLALVDSDHARDQPQVIPFATILSVKGGKTPAHEPFITLALIDPVGVEDSTTLEMIFSQQPYEDRNGECELWVRKLIEHIVSDRHEVSREATVQQPAKTQKIGPAVRRWVAPDKPGPHTTVSHKSRNKSEEILSALQNGSWNEEKPEDPGSLNKDSAMEPDNQEEPAGSREQSENNVLNEDPEAPVKEEDSPSLGNAEEETAPEFGKEPAGSLEPSENNPLPEETGEPVPEPKTEHYDAPPEESVQNTTAETAVAEEDPAVYAPGRNGIAPIPEDEAPVTPPAEPEPAAAEPAPPVPPLDDKQRLMEEDEQALIGKEPEATVPPEPVPAPAAGPEVRSGLPDTVVFPVISGHTGSGESPEQNEKEPVTLPPTTPDPSQPPSRPPAVISPRGIAAIVIAAIVIACLAGAVFVLMSHGAPEEATPLPITPAISVTPTATTVTPVIPGTGVWVRVTYNGTFYGKYGNPGGLREVRGTGDQFYPIKDSTGLVQASFEKLDDSGETLVVRVYTNGTQVMQVEKRMPRATIAILVDPVTGKAPYVPVTTAAP